MADTDDIRQRLERLEAENQRLKREMQKAGKDKPAPVPPGQVIVYESTYQGHPVLKFAIGRRSFVMGLRRLAAVVVAREHILDFVKRHDAGLLEWKVEHGGVVAEDKSSGDVEDVKI